MNILSLRTSLKNLTEQAKRYVARISGNVERAAVKKLHSSRDGSHDLYHDIEVIPFRDIKDFQGHYASVAVERLESERSLSEKYSGKLSWILEGYCACCETDAEFLVDQRYALDGGTPNFRERLTCGRCGLNNRHRFVAAYMKNLLQNSASASRVFCYEQVSNFYRYLSRQKKIADVIGSEYLGADRSPGETINGVRHEDALQLSFTDGSFDFIVSNDVFEHVPDIEKALKEACRCLKRGGRLIFSVPFFTDQKKTVQRTILKDNRIVYLLPECYHGNPVSQKGSLVFYDFGWDILELCRESGFRDAYMVSYYSRECGHMGNAMQYLFCAEK